MHNFQSSLKVGQKGEALFHSMFPKLIATDGRREDFIMPCGRMLDLKSESRTTAETPNLAVELNSSEGRPGAIERAVNDGVEFIVYMFADGEIFVYRARALLNYIVVANHRTVKVLNSSYRTLVMLVPREDVEFINVAEEFRTDVA